MLRSTVLKSPAGSSSTNGRRIVDEAETSPAGVSSCLSLSRHFAISAASFFPSAALTFRRTASRSLSSIFEKLIADSKSPVPKLQIHTKILHLRVHRIHAFVFRKLSDKRVEQLELFRGILYQIY